MVESAHENANTAKERQKMSSQWSMAGFIYALVVCLASSLQSQYRSYFGDFMRKLVYGKPLKTYRYYLNIYRCYMLLPYVV